MVSPKGVAGPQRTSTLRVAFEPDSDRIRPFAQTTLVPHYGTGQIPANFLYGMQQKNKSPMQFDETVLNQTSSLDRTIERTLVQQPEFATSALSELSKRPKPNDTAPRSGSRGTQSKLLTKQEQTPKQSYNNPSKQPVQYIQPGSKPKESA